MPRTPGTRRYIFNTLTVVSLLLLLATVGMLMDLWGLETAIANNYQNDELVIYLEGHPRDQLIAELLSKTLTPETVHADVSLPGLQFYSSTASGTKLTFLSVSLYLLTFAFTMLPAIWLFKWNKRRKLNPNACTSCGYDLTGNESGGCPECGGRTKAEIVEI